MKHVIGIAAALLWVFWLGPVVGARRFLFCFGLLCLYLSFSRHTRVGGIHSSPESKHPATKAERVILFIFGGALMVGASFGWLH